MSLDTVVEDIREQARARASEIREEAQQEAEQIREEAQQEADEIHEDRLAEAERTIEQEREQRVSSAKLEAKQHRLEARRDAIESAHDRAREAIAEMEGDQRKELTETLLADAAAEFEGQSARVYGRADDGDLIKGLLEEYENFEYAGEVDCLGGVVVESEQSQVRVKNTFDSVFEEVWESNLKEISDRLFEQ
jgi:V/A-type H+-transporting ATPase subunit E